MNRLENWIDVRESLPPFDYPVICLCEDGSIMVGAYTYVGEDDDGDGGCLWEVQTSHYNLADPRGLELDDDYDVIGWFPFPDDKNLIPS